jgi:hypothetical protein
MKNMRSAEGFQRSEQLNVTPQRAYILCLWSTKTVCKRVRGRMRRLELPQVSDYKTRKRVRAACHTIFGEIELPLYRAGNDFLSVTPTLLGHNFYRRAHLINNIAQVSKSAFAKKRQTEAENAQIKFAVL